MKMVSVLMSPQARRVMLRRITMVINRPSRHTSRILAERVRKQACNHIHLAEVYKVQH